MSTSDSSKVRAVAYYRMSSDKQEDSIPQQRAAVVPRAEREGITIVTDFKDEALSGGGMKKRDGFLDMLAYCQDQHKKGTPVDAIVCWDTARLSRATSWATGAYLLEFMKAGVFRLFTVANGWKDFRKAEDRVIFNVGSDMGDNKYLVDLSRNIARGKLGHHEAGYFNGGWVPMGFDRLLIDAQDNPVRRVVRGERIKYKEQGWNLVLVPTEDQEALETVRWLFNEYAYSETSFRGLACQLNSKGIGGPGSNSGYFEGKSAWTSSQVKRVLTNPHYVGGCRFGWRASGAYHRVIEGKVEPVEMEAKRQYFPDAPVKENVHEAVIDRATWDRVQGKIKSRATKAQKYRGNGYALSSGLLCCGHCGYRMAGESKKTRGKKKTHRYYFCSGNHHRPGTCQDYSIREDRILPFVIKKLQEEYLNPERLESLHQELRRQNTQSQETQPKQGERLRAKLATLDKDISRAVQNLKRAPENVVGLLLEELSQLQSERVRVEGEIKALEAHQAAPSEDKAQRLDKTFAQLQELSRHLKHAKPEKLRAALAMIVQHIKLFFEDGPRRKKQWFKFSHGVFTFVPNLGGVDVALP
jgi:site-specific DNA recombinase